jgi:hypothetical protein
MQSEQINELALALSRAQSHMTGALKDSANPFYKSRYADLNSVWDACRNQLSGNGLSVIQTTDLVGDIVVVRTTLAHSSGQWIAGVLPVKAKDDGPQAQGSGITYARRYALAAIVGLAQIDDDAEAAQGRAAPAVREIQKVDTKQVNACAKEIINAVDAENAQLVRELFQEAKEASPEFASAVWACLPTTIKNWIKDQAKGAL